MTTKMAIKILREVAAGTYDGKPAPMMDAIDMAIYSMTNVSKEAYENGVKDAINACAKLLKQRKGMQ